MSREPADTTPAEKPDDEPAKPNPFVALVATPAARAYLIVAGGGAVATCAAVWLLNYSPIGAAILLLMAVTSLALRWTAMPVAFAVLVCWLTLFPMVVPLPDFLPPFSLIPEGQFRLADLILAGTTLVYLIGTYRYYAAVHAGMPFDAAQAFIRRGAKATVRGADRVGDGELWRFAARLGGFVLGGQLLWTAVTLLVVDFTQPFPVVKAEINYGGYAGYGNWQLCLSRLLLAAAAFAVPAVVLAFGLWFRRLSRMNRDEARLVLVDEQWRADRREYNRPEKWRGWMIDRLRGKAEPKKGCGTYFLVFGLPLVLVALFGLAVMCCGGGFR